MALAIGSLMAAGLLALVLVAARMPGISSLIPDPQFPKRCLVIHVNLALGLWLFAFLGALASLVDGPQRRREPRSRMRIGPWFATAGLGLMLASAAFTRGKAVLSNYVPVIDHWLFFAGLGMVAAALAALFLGRLASVFRDRAAMEDFRMPARPGIPAAATAGLRAAMILFLLALATLYGSALSTPRDLPADSYYELLFWGPGHILQAVHMAGMLSAWILLVTRITGVSPLSGRSAGILFGCVVVPAALGPLLSLAGSQDIRAHGAFTQVMRFGTWPPALIILAACLRALRLRRAALSGPCFTGFAASAGLTVLGFILGACIRGPNTMIPAHYHASVGGVTAAYMAMAYWLAERRGSDARKGWAARLSAWQPAAYGIGQAVFAIGFGFAGAHGAARKAYGQEQHLKTLSEQVGMAVMGAGGLVAVAAGLAFLVLSVRMLASGRRNA
jgi:hypothetical protein